VLRLRRMDVGIGSEDGVEAGLRAATITEDGTDKRERPPRKVAIQAFRSSPGCGRVIFQVWPAGRARQPRTMRSSITPCNSGRLVGIVQATSQGIQNIAATV
jgi:hypothetical protein